MIKANRRPAMVILAGCFALSAVARVADPTSAFAVELPKMAAGIGNAETSKPSEAMPTDAELGGLLQALRERERQLDARQRRIGEKAKVIEAAEAKLRDQMSRLEAAEARLGALLRLADQAADQDVGKLVTAFQSMDGKKAGPIFENMDVAFAAGLISRMDGVDAAEILSVLSPEKAYAVTVHIAGQNARAPER
ncbi:MAG: hypothetical protein AAF360_00495 [Pseudomonadota bacterium]